MDELLIPVLNQMVYLFVFIIIGYVLCKFHFIPENSTMVLSKLENMVFLPAAVMMIFITDCTPDKIMDSWAMFLGGFALTILCIPLSILSAKLCFKEDYLRKITTYGLTFSNFGFMGLAVVPVVFPELALEYAIFTLPLWFMIYAWGAPALLISGSSIGEKVSIKQRAKAFINPMMIGMLIGLIIGLCGAGAYIPISLSNVLTAGKSCMAPIAMMLTGMTIAKINILDLLKKWRIYIIAVIKLLVYPLIFIALVVFIPRGGFFNDSLLICAFCVMCMPMGLNAIVIPAGYGKDTTDAAGMALITHLLSVITIPLLFSLFVCFVL